LIRPKASKPDYHYQKEAIENKLINFLGPRKKKSFSRAQEILDKVNYISKTIDEIIRKHKNG
jgi:hypothetical protein